MTLRRISNSTFSSPRFIRNMKPSTVHMVRNLQKGGIC